MRFWVGLLAVLIIAGVADAHERSRSNSIWQETEAGLTGRIYLEARQATLLLSLEDSGVSLQSAFQQRLIEGIAVSRGGGVCALQASPQIQLRPDGRLEGVGFWACPESGLIEIDVQVFSPLSANHVHFIRLESESHLSEQVLSRGRTTARFGDERHAAPARWTGFLGLGFEHILAGPDHVAFVIGLILLVTRWRRLALVTLGFTLGHSLTLALAVIGWVSPPGAAIESLIGFSILFIAAEAALAKRTEFAIAGWSGGTALAALAALSALSGGLLAWPVWISLIVLTLAYFQWLASGGNAQTAAPVLSGGFGLVHGVGFAGILLEIDMSREALITSLLAFNIGVELGQLTIVAGVLILAAIVRLVAPDRILEYGRAAALAGLAFLGSFWFLGRAFG
ncbi:MULTISPECIES: HupE/UreJ family protein [Hyphobacterium]|uniref:HupE/UreJ family protein n=1 Tax=Hyphobacterium vulgare TaxID=1736751 RepID=A0ABV7A0S5_9PROT